MKVSAVAEVPPGLLSNASVLDSVFATLPQLFFLTERDGTILDQRGGLDNDLYVPRSQQIGRKFVDFLPTEVAAQLDAALAEVCRTGEPASIEYVLKMPRGFAAFAARVQPLGARVLVEICDITDRRTVEEALRVSEAGYRRIVETANEGIVTVDREARLQLVHKRLARMLGYRVEDMVGRSAFDFLDPDSRQYVVSQLAVPKAGQGRRIELVLQHRDGSTLNVLASASALFDDAGRYAGAFAMVADVSAHRQAEAESQRMQTLVKSIVEHSPSLIFVKDARDLRMVLVNKATEDLLGLTREEMVGRTDFELFLPEEADFFTAKDREVLTNGQLVVIPEEVIVTRNQGLRYLRTLKVPIFDEQGRGQYLLGMSEDITERRKLEEQLRQAQKLEAIGTLAGGIAHDFNNLLGSILGFSELARADSVDGTRLSTNLDHVLAAGRRAKALVTQILAFSREQVPERRAIDFGSAVSDSMRDIARGLPSTVQLQVRVQPELPLVFADLTQMHQVLMNLTTNAVQAMPDNRGRLEVTVDHMVVTPEDAATRIDQSPGSYVRLLVRDDGFGMDAATRARSFEPFFTTKRAGVGTGLGLSVVHGIVKSHGGAIVVDSMLGRGTSIEVMLPVHEEPDGAAWEAPRGAGERILLVDDDVQMLEFARTVLEQLGYHVSAFSDPRAALDAFMSCPYEFQLLVTDLRMPSLSGPDLAHAVRRERPTMPVLLITAFLGDLPEGSLTALDIPPPLIKPVTRKNLAIAVHAAVTS